MNIFGDLPSWAIVFLALLVAAILLLQNIGWLLAARGLLDAQRRKGHPLRAAASGSSVGAEQEHLRKLRQNAP